jgi:hypothetical protein
MDTRGILRFSFLIESKVGFLFSAYAGEICLCGGRLTRIAYHRLLQQDKEKKLSTDFGNGLNGLGEPSAQSVPKIR